MRLFCLLSAVALLAGCGTATTTGSAAPASSGPPAGRASGPAPHGCAAPGKSVTITNADNGSVVCLTTGGTLTLALSGNAWKKPTVDTGILKPAGDTTFTAVSEGKTSLTSSRPTCPAATIACHALQAFQVQVVVS